ncbi:hypothetical protein [Sanguibacter massiliensis]|uniref:hypothetical protein n=1 Tax=Sanguibacter massiliensis TaxID=1973217 RepID=UPI000C818C3E|nr:hypothetical protein [Sanguibacter massiliensis]
MRYGADDTLGAGRTWVEQARADDERVARERSARDAAERAAARALVEQRNALLEAAYERDAATHRRHRRWLVVPTAALVAYEVLWWGFALRARGRAFGVRDPGLRLEEIRAWTVVAGQHWVVSVVALVVLGLVWWRHARRRPHAPFFELLPDDEARRHPAFTQGAQVPRRIV